MKSDTHYTHIGGRMSGETYRRRVRVKDAAGDSAYSNSASAAR